MKLNIFLGLITALIMSNSIQAQLTELDALEKQMLSKKNYSALLEFFESIPSEKKSARIDYFLGKAYVLTGSYKQAERYFDEGLKKDKKCPLNYIGNALLKLKEGQTEAAEKLFETATDYADKNLKETALEIADAFVISKSQNMNYPLSLLKSVEKSKSDPEINVKAGEISFAINDASSASMYFRNALNSDEKNIEALIGLAVIYTKVRNFEESESLLKKAKEIDSLSADVYLAFSEYYAAIRKYEPAQLNYQRYIELSDINSEKISRYAELLFLARRYEKAAEQVNELRSMGVINEQSQHILAFSYRQMNDWENGIPAFQTYFEIAGSGGENSSDYDNYAYLLALSGQTETALQYYIKANTLNTTDCEILGHIADTYYKLKTWNEAITNYLRKQKCGGKLSIRELMDLGRSRLYIGDFVNADSVFIKITDLKPDFAPGHLMRARANSSIDSSSEKGLAKIHYEKFISLLKDDTDIKKFKNEVIEACSYLGFFYYLKKDDPDYSSIWKENYGKYWNRVLELDSENFKAKEAIKILKNIK